MRLPLFIITLVITVFFAFLFIRQIKKQKPRKAVKIVLISVFLALSLCLNVITGYHASLPMIELNNTYTGEFHELHYTFTWKGHHYAEKQVLYEMLSYDNDLLLYGYAEDMHMVSPFTSKIHGLIEPRIIYTEKGDRDLKTLYLKGRSSGSDRDGIVFERVD